jgi:hypothetical protein
MESARKSVSFLFRDVLVGDLYNYYTDKIFKSEIPFIYIIIHSLIIHLIFSLCIQTGSILVPSECIHIDQKTIPETERYFFFNQPATFKSSWLGSTNSKLNESLEQDAVDLNLLWFSNFLKTSPGCCESDENEALVVVFFRVVRRTETLDQQFLDSKLYDYQLESGGWATHLVEHVVYGAELICSMSRPVDWCRETKHSAEENIYLLAKAYFDRIIGPNAINIEPPAELDKISCRILSSLEDVQPTETSFRQSCEFLRDVINFKEDNQPTKLWRPIYIVRRQIPKQIETRILLDKIMDDKLKIERKLHWILSESRRISKHPFLTRIPPMERAIYQFISLLQRTESEILKFDVNLIARKCLENPQGPQQDKITNDLKAVSDCALLSNMIDWLMRRRSEIDTIHMLFRDTLLDIFDLEDIETRPPSNFDKRARIFILKIDYIPDPLMECIQDLTGVSIEPVFKLPVFPAVSSGRKRLSVMRRAFVEFTEEARWGSNEKNSYHIGLAPASLPMEDGTIKTILYPAVQQQASPRVCLPVYCSGVVEPDKSNPIKQQQQLSPPNGLSHRSNGSIKPPTDSNLSHQKNIEKVYSLFRFILS